MMSADRDRTAVPVLSVPPLDETLGGLPDGSAAERAQALILGVAICSLLPAAFWCFVIWLAAPLTGLHLSASSLATVGATIGLFLTVVSSAILGRH